MNGFTKHLSNFSFLITLSLLMVLSACVSSGDSSKLNDLTGVVPITTPIPKATAYTPPETARLKIFTVSGTSSVGTTALTVGDTFQLRAVLVDSTGSIISEVDATWSVTGTLGTSNLTTTAGDPGPRATFTAAAVSTGTVQAVIDSAEIATYSNYNITSTTASTGTITVSLALTPDQILIVSGNNQTGQVGTNLGTQLKVRVINAASTVVPGVNVTFAVLSGGGQIISAQPVATDASGEALCTVKLGGQTGASGQSFTATISSGSVTQVVLYATGTPGPASKLSFYQQPAIANVGAAFSTQPVVEIQDSYGNRTTTATNTVTLARNAGTGTLTGSVSVAASSGLATFSNVGHDTAENGVTITASSAGLTSATSTSFNVGSVTALAQCLVNDGTWTTTDGGCKNIATGLVWSARSAATMNWYQAVWRFGDSGSSSPEAWETAKGLTTDIVGAATDLNGTAYCHDLTESGMTDWRAPTFSEAYTVYTTYFPTTYLQQNNAVIWAGDWNATPYGYGGNFGGAAGSWGGYTPTNTNYARCVRRPPPTKLIITQQPAAATRGFGVHVPFETPLIVKIADNTNSIDTTASNTITLSHNGTGQFCWTNRTTGVTSGCGATITLAASAGVATFTNLTYSKAETISIQASATGLTGVTSSAITINQTYPYANCLNVVGTWINAQGGCKSLVTGRVYSVQSSSVMNWHSAIWDESTAGNAGSVETSDNAATTDYSNSAGTFPDNSSTDYCHDLQESGKTDWKLADYYDISQMTTESPNANLRAFNGGAASYYLWTAYTFSTDTNAYMFYPNNYGWYTAYAKTSTYNIMCVRSDPPSQLVFVQQPSGHPTYGLGAGIPFYYQPIIEVRDSDGAPLTGLWRYNNPQVYPTVTLTVIGGTGNLWIGNTNYGASVSTTVALNGRATFSGVWYDKPSETIQLRASFSNMTWNGAAVSLSTLNSNNLVIPAIYAGTQCTATANWTSQYGGCGDTLAGGLVWSHTFNLGASWYQAMWDSAYPGEQATDGSDGALTNHYDAAYPAGTGTVNTVYTSDCHSLNLNGYTDWRMPTRAELQTAFPSTGRQGYAAVKNLAGASYVWSSSTDQGNNANAYMFHTSNGTIYSAGTPLGYVKTYGGSAIICVRPSTP